jgi:phosphohistidine swiveling domain-containing protein
MKFASKAETLELLQTCLTKGKVLPQWRITAKQWQTEAATLLESFVKQFSWAQEPLVVRSSGLAEDSNVESLAGHYTSLLNIQGQAALQKAIEAVITSFDTVQADDQVFVQPMLCNVARSGVVFTTEPSTGSPYYVINYSESGSTDSVTSGCQNDELIYVAKHYSGAVNPSWIKALVALCEELQQFFASTKLDIEFAFTDTEDLILFQVRPLIIESSNKTMSDAQHNELLGRIHHSLQRIHKPHPYLNGKKSVLGVMPDWNPAEIIGIRPSPLALSLYKELVTNSIWAYQRNNYGYKQLRSFPLLISLAGLPYIDVRVSFNSFIPADISNELAEKLVNYYINQLEISPEKHDKIEFEIIFSCFTLDIEHRLAKLADANFNPAEIEQLTQSLKRLTNNIINPHGLWTKDIAKIESLPARRQTILQSNLTTIEKIYWLLEDCKRYGTLPFAGLARAGFIAVQFLKSMIADEILSTSDYEKFMRSLETVSSNMAKDRSELSFSAFLTKYGHLRPGTYNILSPRYDQAPQKYFDQKQVSNEATVALEEDFSLSLKQLEKIKSRLEFHGIEHDVISIFRFIKGAIEGREYAKFVFTQSLSDAMLLIEKLGEEHHLSIHDMSFCDVAALYKAYSSTDDIVTVISESIVSGKSNFTESQSLILPPLIIEADDIYCFKMPEGEPNFITLKQVVAPIATDLELITELNNKIVFIPSADPGFDWLFSHNIAGLITQYGGANSHMAIRAGELGIPSVIGAGELLYKKWSKASLIELDAVNRKVTVLK